MIHNSIPEIYTMLGHLLFYGSQEVWRTIGPQQGNQKSVRPEGKVSDSY